jgi:hypothetical protein
MKTSQNLSTSGVHRFELIFRSFLFGYALFQIPGGINLEMITAYPQIMAVSELRKRNS